MKPATVFLGEMTDPEVEAFLQRPPDGHRADRLHRAARSARPAPDRRARPERGGPPRRAAGRRASSRRRSTTRCRTRTSGFTGVVHIRIPTFMALIEDLCASLASIGFRRIVFLNGHYDNTYAIAYACANAADRLPEGVLAFPVNYWDGMTGDRGGRVLRPVDRAAREPGGDVGRPGDRPGARGHGQRQRRDAAVPRGHEPGPGAHRVLLLGPGLGPSRHQVGDVGRRPRGDGGVRRAIPGGRDRGDGPDARRHRPDATRRCRRARSARRCR